MEGRRLGHLFLVEEGHRGVVIATIAVIDRVRNPKTVLDKVEREHIVGARGTARDVGHEVEHLAAGHLERPQMFSDGVLASDLENDRTVVSVEVVTRDLLILDIEKCLFGVVDSALISSLNVGNFVDLSLQVGQDLGECLTSIRRVGEGHGGEHGEHAEFSCD